MPGAEAEAAEALSVPLLTPPHLVVGAYPNSEAGDRALNQDLSKFTHIGPFSFDALTLSALPLRPAFTHSCTAVKRLQGRCANTDPNSNADLTTRHHS